VLGLLTVLVAATVRPLRSAAGALRGGAAAGQPAGPADAILLARAAAAWLAFGSGPATRCVDWADRRLAVRLRAHPLRASAVFALAFGAVIDAPQVVIEGYPPPLAVVFVAVSACSVFAFLAMAGAAVGWVERRRPRASTGVRVLVAAAASVPLAAAFRDGLWPLIGVDPQHGGLGDLVTLMAAAAAATGLVTSVTDATFRRMSR